MSDEQTTGAAPPVVGAGRAFKQPAGRHGLQQRENPMIARIAVLGLLAVNVALVPWSGGGAAPGLGRPELSAMPGHPWHGRTPGRRSGAHR